VWISVTLTTKIGLSNQDKLPQRENSKNSGEKQPWTGSLLMACQLHSRLSGSDSIMANISSELMSSAVTIFEIRDLNRDFSSKKNQQRIETWLCRHQSHDFNKGENLVVLVCVPHYSGLDLTIHTHAMHPVSYIFNASASVVGDFASSNLFIIIEVNIKHI